MTMVTKRTALALVLTLLVTMTLRLLWQDERELLYTMQHLQQPEYHQYQQQQHQQHQQQGDNNINHEQAIHIMNRDRTVGTPIGVATLSPPSEKSRPGMLHRNEDTETFHPVVTSSTTIASSLEDSPLPPSPPTAAAEAAAKDEVRVLDAAATAALDFVLARQAAYATRGMQHWHMRGLGYLYTQHDRLLVANVPHLWTTATDRMMMMMTDPAGRQEVRIYNVHPNATSSSSSHSQCNLRTIWVRVLGPEIFAGTATAVFPKKMTKEEDAVNERTASSCYWSFAFLFASAQ